jgi:hypothetical protein
MAAPTAVRATWAAAARYAETGALERRMSASAGARCKTVFSLPAVPAGAAAQGNTAVAPVEKAVVFPALEDITAFLLARSTVRSAMSTVGTVPAEVRSDTVERWVCKGKTAISLETPDFPVRSPTAEKAETTTVTVR